MKKVISILLLLFVAYYSTDCVRASKKCKDNAKKVKKLRKSGVLKM
ncbi:MAG: hypothetical protein NZ529_01660 [Cytophagaceae bacterium]|nr:hypothetical protein [Cytophagaceae bacterium]MDW8455473.1 hypothetical protein [Cytophagaceae bacterium]